MTNRRSWGVAAALLGACASAWADWPQFLGPTRDGKSPQTGLDRTLGGGQPKVLWTVQLGEGYGGPAIRDGKVFVLDRQLDARDVLRCLDLKTGTEQWRTAYEAPGELAHDGSRSTPAVDERFVFTVGPFGHFHCISRATRRSVWSKHLLKDFGAELPKWGVGQSPLLSKGWVVVCPLGAKAGVIACDRATGKIVWQSAPVGHRKHSSAFFGWYASVMPGTFGGVEQFLVITNDRACGLRASDGKLLWSYTGRYCKIQIPGPTQIDKDRLFITGGYLSGSAMLRVTRRGEEFGVEEVYKLGPRVCGSQTHQPLLIDGHLYLNSNSNERSDGMMCLTLDGKVKWTTGRSPNFQRGNLIYADGLIYNLDGRTGILHLIQPSPDGYKELAQAKLLGGKEIWAPMAISDGMLVLRDQSQMKCIRVRADSQETQPGGAEDK